MSADTAELLARDPGFDETAFLAGVEAQFVAYYKAREDRTPERMRRTMTNAMFDRYRAEVATGPGPVTAVTVQRARLHRFLPGGALDTIVVRFDGVGRDREKGIERTWVSDWYFQRAVDARTGEASAGRCPHCSAPMAVDEGGLCRYCGVAVASELTDWALSRVEVVSGLSTAVSYEGPSASARTRPKSKGCGWALFLNVAIFGVIGSLALVSYLKTKNDTTPLHPVSDSRIKVPANDLTQAVADLKAKLGRQPALTSVYLYSDNRIVFTVQDPTNPANFDDYTWRRGAITGPNPRRTVGSAYSVFTLEGVRLDLCEQISKVALARSNLDSPSVSLVYLLQISKGLSWYVAVDSAHGSKSVRFQTDGTLIDVN
jgi:hypothetical protein